MHKATSTNNNVTRCQWVGEVASFIPYHDQEWGMPVKDDQRLYEKLCLESFQCGLSWRTILERREHLRGAFFNFDIAKVAQMTDADTERLLGNSNIIRHRGKISATINNAQRAIELIEEAGSLAHFIWQYEPKTTPTGSELRAHSPESAELSKALKKRGWRFVGPTTIYSLMQAMGMVNDHAEDCHCHAKVDQARMEFIRP